MFLDNTNQEKQLKELKIRLEGQNRELDEIFAQLEIKPDQLLETLEFHSEEGIGDDSPFLLSDYQN